MAGHSQFKNIMYRKGAQDAKRAKLFSKLIREVAVAARTGLPDPDKNPRLRAAVLAARSANMPKDNIERAIKKATGDDNNESYDEIRYEGYGPGGVAVIVEALTDNRNRTASELRSAFAKFGGNLGETGSVSFLFDRVGVMHYSKEAATFDVVFEAALEAGAQEVEDGDGGTDVFCSPDDLNSVREALVNDLGEPQMFRLDWKAQNSIEVNEQNADTLFKLLIALDDNDDVQHVAANYEIPNDVLARLSG